MSNWKRFAVVMAVLVSVALPVLVGCSLLKYQFEINNLTSYILKEVNIATDGAASWGSNDLAASLAAGGSVDLKGFAAGDYMVRGVFDVADGDACTNDVVNDEYIVVLSGLPITTTNIAIDYQERTRTTAEATESVPCTEIYATTRFVI